MKFIEKLAGLLNLCFNKACNTAFGSINGINYTINLTNQAIFCINFSVKNGEKALTSLDFDFLQKAFPKTKFTILNDGYQVTIMAAINQLATMKTSLELSSKIVLAIDEFLHTDTWVNTCKFCTESDEQRVAVVGNAPHFNCNKHYAKLEEEYNTAITARANINENVLLGIIGAIIGSLVGALAIVLLAQIGLVSAISGIIMGVATMFGYQLLAKKLSGKGIAICIITMIVVVFLAEMVSWSLAIVLLFDSGSAPGLFEVMSSLFKFLSAADIMGDYFGSLFMSYMFTALGAIPTTIAYCKQSAVPKMTILI